MTANIVTALGDELKYAYARESPIYIKGSATKFRASRSFDGVTLDMSVLNGVIQYEPSELVITVWAGTPITTVLALLKEHSQGLLFEPPLMSGGGTIGGMVASGFAGPARAYKGAVHDYVLGVEMLQYTGERLKFGGTVMKNVAGFDVARLCVGSMGHLGPLLSVSLKVMPLPMKDTTIQRQLSAQDALEWFESLRGTHAPISASSWWAGEACVRLSGSSEVIADCLAHQPTHQTLSDEHADAHWQACQNQTHPVFQDGSLKRVSLPLASADLHEGHTLIEWGGALRWVSQATSEERLRQKVTAMGGTLTAWPCDVTAQTHQLEPALARLNHSIKRVFDPKGLYVPELEAAWKSA